MEACRRFHSQCACRRRAGCIASASAPCSARGVVFLIIALWIAVAAVVGGHYYAIDVVLGAAIALAVDMAWRANLIPSTVFTAPRHRFTCSALDHFPGGAEKTGKNSDAEWKLGG